MSALLVKLLPAIMTPILALLGWACKKLWSAILGKIQNQNVAMALETLGKKAATIVEDIEQTIRPDFALSTSDGKLTKQEAMAIAKTALARLLNIAAPEVKTLEESGMKKDAVEQLAASVLEQAVYRLPKEKPVTMDFQAKVDALRPAEWILTDCGNIPKA